MTMERRMLARDISFFSLRLRARLDIATETNNAGKHFALVQNYAWNVSFIAGH